MFVTPLLGWDFQVPHPTFQEESEYSIYLHPRKLDWQYTNNHLKMYLLSNIVIFYCHVSFRGVVIAMNSKTNQVNIDQADESMIFFAPVWNLYETDCDDNLVV